MGKITFVIAAYNDTQTLIETLDNLFTTVRGVDIIVVDDSNSIKDELDKYPNLIVVRNEQRIGVGQSLDKGVRMAKSEIVFIMGCDIRFSGNWFNRFYRKVKENPKSIVSTVTAGLNVDRRYIKGKENHFYASHILFQVNKGNNSKDPLPFREFIEAKWNKKITGDVEQIGCVLGAFYGCHKSWFEKVSSWRFHETWGNLEPILSMASYLHGGNCLIDTQTITGHIFKSSSSTKPISNLIYNKLLNAYLYLPSDLEKEVFLWARTLKYSEGAFKTFEEMKPQLSEMREFKLSLGDERIRELIKPTGILERVSIPA